MIFVTVGTQLPFDRLVGTVDAWAGRSGESVFAQIGPSTTRFENIETAPFLTPEEAAERVQQASLVVAHAGMGTIFTSLAARRPLIVLPRSAALGEHRNEHQMATARRLGERGIVTVAWDVNELRSRLDSFEDVGVAPAIGDHAEVGLIDAVRDFLER